LRSCRLTSFSFFQGSFPRFQKRSPKTRKRFWAREVRSPANFVDYLPPPLPLRSRKNRRHMYSPEAIPAMQRQGGKTCPCHCIARFLPWVFFASKSCVFARIDNKPISVAPISPPAPSSKPLDTPLLPARPFSQRPSEGARGVCIVAHHVRGQGKDGGGGAARRSPSHRRRR
jgi:hypothetical protein